LLRLARLLYRATCLAHAALAQRAAYLPPLRRDDEAWPSGCTSFNLWVPSSPYLLLPLHLRICEGASIPATCLCSGRSLAADGHRSRDQAPCACASRRLLLCVTLKRYDSPLLWYDAYLRVLLPATGDKSPTWRAPLSVAPLYAHAVGTRSEEEWRTAGRRSTTACSPPSPRRPRPPILCSAASPLDAVAPHTCHTAYLNRTAAVRLRANAQRCASPSYSICLLPTYATSPRVTRINALRALAPRLAARAIDAAARRLMGLNTSMALSSMVSPGSLQLLPTTCAHCVYRGSLPPRHIAAAHSATAPSALSRCHLFLRCYQCIRLPFACAHTLPQTATLAYRGAFCIISWRRRALRQTSAPAGRVRYALAAHQGLYS